MGNTGVGRRSVLAERTKGFFASTNDGITVGEQEMIECLLLTNLQERGFQTTLDRSWVITNQRVGYEAEFAIFIDHRIPDRQNTAGSREEKSRLFRAKYADFKSTNGARQFVAEPERSNVEVLVRKLVQPSLVAPDRYDKVFDKSSAVPIVKPISQINVFRDWPLPEPIDPFLRHQRIDQKCRF